MTSGQQLKVFTPHQVQSVLKVKGHQCLTGKRLSQYWAVFLNPNLILRTCQPLNPETLLPITGEGDLEHSCVETLEQVCSSRPDLQAVPLRR